MKTSLSLVSTLVLLALLAPSPAGAWSLFGSSAEEKLLRRADEAYDAAMEAAEKEDRLSELQLLSSARSGYQRLADEYPSYRAEHVSQRLDAVVLLADSVSAAIDSGESAIADPAAGTARAAEPGAPIAAPDSTDPGAPAFRYPVPALVRTEDSPAPAAEPAPVPEEDDPSLAAAIPNPFFREAASPEPEPAPSPKEPAESAEEASASVEVTLRETVPAAIPPEEDLRNARAFLDMLREARATDAVLLLEDRLEEEGSAASLRTRLMYARALVQCANFRRAADVLAELPKESEADPSVRSLRAAVAVGTDDLAEALLQLTLLLRDHPGYADAYVDLAYVYLLLDPVNNREAAVANYKAGLENGAKRDGRLESALEVTIAR